MIYLASTSKIRRQLLSSAGVAFQALASPLDEEVEKTRHPNLGPRDLAQHLAAAKARALDENYQNDFILGADQTLEFNGEILHKAKSSQEAAATLSRLSGQNHLLHSAIAMTKESEIVFQHVSTARLKMRHLTPDFIEQYLGSIGNDALASPGAYEIEKSGAQLFEDISGDHFAVLGLPLLPILAFLRQIGELPT